MSRSASHRHAVFTVGLTQVGRRPARIPDFSIQETALAQVHYPESAPDPFIMPWFGYFNPNWSFTGNLWHSGLAYKGAEFDIIVTAVEGGVLQEGVMRIRVTQSPFGDNE